MYAHCGKRPERGKKLLHTHSSGHMARAQCLSFAHCGSSSL